MVCPINSRTCQTNDLLRATLTHWVEAHTPALVRACHADGCPPDDVPDLVQETYHRAWEHLQGGGELPDEPAWWLRRIQFNVCRTRGEQRTRWTRHTVQMSEFFDPPGATREPSSDIENQEMVVQLQDAINQLPPELQAVVWLRLDPEPPKWEDVANALGITVGTARYRWDNAVEELCRQCRPDDPC